MKIGWVIPTVGIFGAVREMVETSNVFVRAGHEVVIYSPDGHPCKWLPCLALSHPLRKLSQVRLDVLIGIVDWQPSLFDAMQKASATLKVVCMMGFTPSDEMASALRGETTGSDPAWSMMRGAIEQGYSFMADSSWQTDWMREAVDVDLLPPFGGINLSMFKPGQKTKRTRPIVAGSGDPRPRKGYDQVEAAIDGLPADTFDYETYWGRRFTQPQLVEFLQQVDIFVDAHSRGGWCNPVAEAMACGAAVVCTRIGANAGFAQDGETALTVDPDGPISDSLRTGIERLLADAELRLRLAQNAQECIAQFDYELVAPRVLAALAERL